MALSNTKLKRFIEASGSMKNDPDYPIFQAGMDEGRRQMKVLALTFLEEEYMNPEVERGSPQADIILNLTSRMSAHLNELT